MIKIRKRKFVFILKKEDCETVIRTAPLSLKSILNAHSEDYIYEQKAFYINGEYSEDIDEWIRDYNIVADLQYTNLKDQNGAEVYEHDILNHIKYGFLKVEWDNEYTCWIAIDRQYEKHSLPKILLSETIKVGNIYENEELLSKEK